MNHKKTNRAHLNPVLMKELANLAFVVNGEVLGSDTNAMIISLVEEFDKINGSSSKHNLEISQFFRANVNANANANIKTNKFDCENCELVLKYINSSVCLSDMVIVKESLKCNAHRGSIKFYVKQQNGDCYQYTRIHVVRVMRTNTLQPFKDSIYLNPKELSNIEQATSSALTKAQTETLKSALVGGAIKFINDIDTTKSNQLVGTVVQEATKAATQSQLEKMNPERIALVTPDETIIRIADAVARTIPTKSESILLVPGNNQILLGPNNSGTQPTQMTIFDQGISSSKIIPSEAAIDVTATLVVVPTKNIIMDKSTKVATVPKSESILNELNTAAVGILSSIDRAFNKLTHTTMVSGESVVTPITNKLSVMTNQPHSNIQVTTFQTSNSKNRANAKLESITTSDSKFSKLDSLTEREKEKSILKTFKNRGGLY